MTVFVIERFHPVPRDRMGMSLPPWPGGGLGERWVAGRRIGRVFSRRQEAMTRLLASMPWLLQEALLNLSLPGPRRARYPRVAMAVTPREGRGTPKVLVTGAGGGLGSALVRLYAARGWEVQPLARGVGGSPSPPEGGPGRILPPWTCDLSDPARVADLCRDPARMAGFDLAIFAAGTSEAGPIEALPPMAFRRCLEVNFLAPLALWSALTQSRAPCRRFVFVLSGAAELLVPGLGPYALSKRALRDWLALAAIERARPGSRRLAVWPGPMATAFDRNTTRHGGYVLPSRGGARAPEEVARRILAAEERGQRRLLLSPLPNALGRLQALAPGLLTPLVRRRR